MSLSTTKGDPMNCQFIFLNDKANNSNIQKFLKNGEKVGNVIKD